MKEVDRRTLERLPRGQRPSTLEALRGKLPDASEPAIFLLSKMLSVDPHARWSAGECLRDDAWLANSPFVLQTPSEETGLSDVLSDAAGGDGDFVLDQQQQQPDVISQPPPLQSSTGVPPDSHERGTEEDSERRGETERVSVIPLEAFRFEVNHAAMTWQVQEGNETQLLQMYRSRFIAEQEVWCSRLHEPLS
uniref:Protein kinase domain-containing protein n=1 Tax=Chromera velia CCMP2878 TaxID=1169474 RepID=A0A0G4HAA4_9ALVE|eukprot:Cvel_25481.t1-p1 / transcript=Cvel_25481.t1 / gene=Cvel_25481 / organism=Chromera_velia_CCMP2878 / gene_product=hypothetical protein / transcript_product=hypothetical protein / location=Cvel_scaffold2894:3381-4930(-) / protein_length=192 / sequence_SO=supercontig / SO=protein_coding / is_pseudo=false